jgi:Fe-Mn family superoxide dismutase
MEHTLPPLPYAIDALAPHYSQETICKRARNSKT